MNGQFSDKAADRARAEIDVGKTWVTSNRQGRVVRWRKTQAGLRQPMRDESLEMLPAADALHVLLAGERGMPGEDLDAVKPAILDHEKPSRVAKCVEAANGARRAFCDCVIHGYPPHNQLALPAARLS